MPPWPSWPPSGTRIRYSVATARGAGVAILLTLKRHPTITPGDGPGRVENPQVLRGFLRCSAVSKLGPDAGARAPEGGRGVRDRAGLGAPALPRRPNPRRRPVFRNRAERRL